MKYVIDPKLMRANSILEFLRTDIDLLEWKLLNMTTYDMLLPRSFSFIPMLNSYLSQPDHEPITLISNDPNLASMFKLPVSVVRLEDLPPLNDEELFLEKKRRFIARTRKIIFGPDLRLYVGKITGTVCAAIVCGALLVNFSTVVETLGTWFACLLVPIAGILFYLWRQRGRLYYGIFEVIVGVYTPIRTITSADPNVAVSDAQLLAIVGGVYIIIRGMDNISKGLEGKPLKERWDRIFG